MKQQSKRKYRLTIKLDPVMDADLIAWLETIPEGYRSQAVREGLRIAISPSPAPDLDAIRGVVAEELASALSGRQVTTQTLENETEEEDAEAKYGAKLDRMLGKLSTGGSQNDNS